MKLKTINVVEMTDEDIISIHSFSDDAKGYKEAIDLFSAIMEEQGATKREIEITVKDACWVQGDYHTYICNGE